MFPRSHPFVEQLIGTLRCECLDHTLFWNALDLEQKLTDFQVYYNRHRTHRSLDGNTPADVAGGDPEQQVSLIRFSWRTHCRGLYQLPAAV